MSAIHPQPTLRTSAPEHRSIRCAQNAVSKTTTIVCKRPLQPAFGGRRSSGRLALLARMGSHTQPLLNCLDERMAWLSHGRLGWGSGHVPAARCAVLLKVVHQAGARHTPEPFGQRERAFILLRDGGAPVETASAIEGDH